VKIQSKLAEKISISENIDTPVILFDNKSNIVFLNSHAKKTIQPLKKVLINRFSKLKKKHGNAKFFMDIITFKNYGSYPLNFAVSAYRIEELFEKNSSGYLLIFHEQLINNDTPSLMHISKNLKETGVLDTMALSKSEQKYRMLFNNVKDGIYITTSAGKFLDVNQAMVKIYGYDNKEDLLLVSIGKDLYLNLEDRKKFLKELHKNGYVTNYECKFKKKNGDIITCLESSYAIKNDNGEVLQYQGTIVDITERKKLEEQIKQYADQLEMKVEERTRALQESEARYSTLFHNVPIGVYISSPEGKFIDVNPAIIEIFGYENKLQMLSIDIGKQMFISSEDRKRFLQRLKDKGFIQNYEIQYRKKDGSVIACLESSYAIKDKNNKILSFQGTLIDVTKRKKLEEQLKEYSNKLEQKVKEKTEELIQAYKLASLGRLTAGVAHEINNPLLALDGTLQMLIRKTRKDDKEYHTFNQMHKVANRIKNIIEKLLLFSHPRLEKKQKENINLLIENTLAISIELIKKKKIIIKKEFQVDLPEISVIADQLQQVFMNIIFNAYDAMNQGDELTIKTWHDTKDSKIYISFKDTGHGIKEEHKSKIFDPFFTTKEVGKGTGLGLSISYGIIKNLGGTIDFESEEDKETTFTMSLPV
jgi:two-component system NtrC family sensor kinase